jgi:3-deoxy-manno-octulosonate cytidylyltransferase (CMP-KDO synthetase)
MDFLVVIPARYESSRLPGKPLIELCGVPMIIRTYQQCVGAVPPDHVVVATDDVRIREACESRGIRVVMTSSGCLTGTDRLAEVAQVISARTYINVQGDEPVFNPQDLSALIDVAGEHPDQIINGYCTISDEDMFRSGSVPKVVMRPDGRLLYMSRAAVPTSKQHGFSKAWRQVCAYAFPKNALEAFTAVSAKTPLEAIEDIEILRFLELGWDVRMIPMSDSSVAVDTPEDIVRAESAIRLLGLQ